MDTDMAADVDAPKLAPADLVVQVLEALEKGEEEVLGDETSRFVKSVLSGPPAHLVSDAAGPGPAQQRRSGSVPTGSPCRS